MRPSLMFFLILAACKSSSTPEETGPTCIVGFADRDGDGFGNPRQLTSSCQERVVENEDDCDDLFNTAYPGAPEICDGVDNDCDGLVDSDDTELGLAPQYVDADGDGFGAGPGVAACEPLPDHVAIAGDCDDADPDTSPGVPEICDLIDNNCDGQIDDDDFDDLDYLNVPEWFFDGDGDGYAGPVSTAACVQPAGTGTASVDCDDTRPLAFPGADERCNDQDDDCDGFGDAGGPCVDFEGAWSGTFSMVLSGPSTHTCSGTVSLDVTQFDSSPVQGTYTCTFDSEQGWDLVQHGAITGVHYADGAVTGTLTTLGNVYPWEGTLAAGVLQGTVDGLLVRGATVYDVEASLQLGLPPAP